MQGASRPLFRRPRFVPDVYSLLALQVRTVLCSLHPPLTAVHALSSWFSPSPTFLTPPRSFHQMFTPPPSPLPQKEPPLDRSAPAAPPESPPSATAKRKTASRIRWSILAVPIVLVLITLTTRYISHPVAFDSFSALHLESHDSSQFDDWGLHKRHPSPATPHVARASDSPTPSVTSVPTIPDNPPIPTPFPQPFDTTLSKNFSTQACVNFYTNMTLSLPFRRCRPFGLLAEYSSQFIEVSAWAADLYSELTVPKAGTDQRDVTERHDLGHMQHGPGRRHLFRQHELVRILAQDSMCYRTLSTESIRGKYTRCPRSLFPLSSSWMSIKPRHKCLLLRTSGHAKERLRPLLLPGPIRSPDSQQHETKLLVVH